MDETEDGPEVGEMSYINHVHIVCPGWCVVFPMVYVSQIKYCAEIPDGYW